MFAIVAALLSTGLLRQTSDLHALPCARGDRPARFSIHFDKVEIEKLVQTVADLTCRTYILGDNIHGKISIVGPDQGRGEVDAEQFYAAFLAALDANQLALVTEGSFSKIVEKSKARQHPIPLVNGAEPQSTREQMMTRLFRVRFTELDALRAVVQQLVSPGGDVIPYQPDTLIVNELGSNMSRLERIIEQLDIRSGPEGMRVLQIRFAPAVEVASTLQKLLDAKSPRAASVSTPGAAGATTGAGSALSMVLVDERTNKLIVLASPGVNERIDALLRELDVPLSGDGRISVHALKNANAEDLAATLQSLGQGSGSRRAVPANQSSPLPAGAVRSASSAPNGTAELFQGEVKISADKATNSLVIIAGQHDLQSLLEVIDRLDVARRQVFIEAVIMEVNLDRTAQFGLSLHQGYSVGTSSGTAAGVVGTNYSAGSTPASFSISNLTQYGGFVAGIQGPTSAAFEKLGISIPSFGIVLHALQQNSDVNVLSTPHLLTSDNEEAEIEVGQNVPFQAGFTPQTANGTTSASSVASTQGLSSYYAPINRQNVELKLAVKPQISEGNNIRMTINESTEEIASQDAQLGPTTSKRTAKTTVVARDQETVVIGGIIQERTIESTSKVPFLGDVPLLGQLFRETSRRKVKVNLLLFLTPYIIRDAMDFRRIFEMKMAERQRFVEEFYGQVPGYDVHIDFDRKAGPLARMNQRVIEEERKLENGGPGLPSEKVFNPALQPDPGTTPHP